VPLMRRRLFSTCGMLINATIAAVIADARYVRSVVYYCRVVDIVDDSFVYVVHRAIVKKASVVPTPTFIAMAEVTEAITDPAIETYMWTPVTFIENKAIAAPTPVARGPQQADFRSQDPSPRDPIIIVAVPTPVPRYPDVPFVGARRLVVDGELRRGKVNRYADLGERYRQRQHGHHE